MSVFPGERTKNRQLSRLKANMSRISHFYSRINLLLVSKKLRTYTKPASCFCLFIYFICFRSLDNVSLNSFQKRRCLN